MKLQQQGAALVTNLKTCWEQRRTCLAASMAVWHGQCQWSARELAGSRYMHVEMAAKA